MTQETYRKDLREKVSRLKNMLTLYRKLGTDIAKLRREIGHLSELVGQTRTDDLIASMPRFAEGLTQACREALLTFSESATANEVMEIMLIMGFSPRAHSNLLASVQTTLKRMPDVEESEKNGKKAYRLTAAD